MPGSLQAQEFQLWRGAPLGGQAGHVNGALALSASIGSPAAGTHANGEFQLESGFISAVLSAASPPPDQPPVILDHPVGASVAHGAAVSFQVNASGTPPLQYQWRFNGQPIAGAVDSILLVDPVVLNRAGFYSVRVSNAYGTVISQSAPLVVVAAPAITLQPVSQSVAVGQPFSLTVLAWGTPPLAYRWFHNGQPIPGAISSTFSVAAASAFNSGLYEVAVSNVADTVRSTTAAISVLAPPRILVQPSGLSVDPGEQAMFSVQADGTPSLYYQWHHNGILLPGATNDTLIVPNAQLAQAGLYRVQVRNAAGFAVSQPAELTVLLNRPVLNGADLFADRALMPLPGSQGGVVGNNIGYTLETNERRHARKPGGSSAWFLWTPLSNGVASMSTLGSSFDTLLAVYTGSSLAKLAEKDADDDSGPGHTSEVFFNALAGTDYAIALDGFVGQTGKFALNYSLEVTGLQLPEIVSHPTRQTLPQGSTATFQVQATGSDLSYQWFFNGSPVDDATNDSLVLANLQPDHVGTYRVWVSNQLGRVVRSRPATLELGPSTDVFSLDKIAELKPKFPQPLPAALIENGSVPSALRSMAAGITPPSSGFSVKYWVNGFGYGTEDDDGVCCGNTSGLVYNNATHFAVYYQASNHFDGILVFEIPEWSGQALIAAFDTNTFCVACTNGASLRMPVSAGSIFYPSITLFDYDERAVPLEIKFDLALSNAYTQVETTVVEGRDLTLQALATNTLAQASYQWFFNGNLIPGATNAQYSILDTSYDSAGVYEVLLSNPACATMSVVADVLIIPPPSLQLAFEQLGASNQLCITAYHSSELLLLQGSADFVHWTDLAISTSTAREITFIDPLPDLNPIRFFRAAFLSTPP